MINIYKTLLLDDYTVTIDKNVYGIDDSNILDYKDRKIILLGEDLFTKSICAKTSIKEYEIKENILSYFGEDDDYLFHTMLEKNKRNLTIYVTKGGLKVAKLCEEACKVKVIPVQFLICNILKRKIRKNEWSALVYTFNRYYLIIYKNKLINSIVSESLDIIEARILDMDKNMDIYLEEKIELRNLKFENKIYKLGGKIGEKQVINKRFFAI